MIIHIIEDDKALSDGIIFAVREPEMDFIQSFTIKQAKEMFLKTTPNLMILDINLPDGNGYDYLKWVRGHSNLPVLMLTANDMEMDEVRGFSLGADDYVTKPFSLAVLRARIKALLRRNQDENINSFREDDFLFDFERILFTKKGQEILLSVNEQRLLKLLVENRERILTRNMLMDYIWSDGYKFVDENTLSVIVNRLRNKLEDKKDGCTYIQTVYGQGYIWKKKTEEG